MDMIPILILLFILIIAPVTAHCAEDKLIIASYYSPKLENKRMANGNRYHGNEMAVAYNKWPIGTRVKITNPETGASAYCAVTDRKRGNGIDLSMFLYKLLGLDVNKGTGKVKVEKEF